jgi:hypothetical protein
MISAAQLAQEMDRLKDFQRATVEHVHRRLYLDDPPAKRFLVADEVGLGKTLVARGVIAKALNHLHGKVPRIDIVYVCSNAAIAAQNLQRLDVLGQERAAFATRLTLLPTQISSLAKNTVNFVSFTPGTTFDLKSRGGKMEERALLMRMLVDRFGLRKTPLRNLLQANASDAGWDRYLEGSNQPMAEDLVEKFRHSLEISPTLAKLHDACERFARRKDNRYISREDNECRYDVIGELRRGLAQQCIEALEPDLVIVDEFQRFKHLLHGADEAAELAQQLFSYENARVLLLSATPYKMLTFAHEVDDDHYKDFLETVRFLADGDSAVVERLKVATGEFRRALHRSDANRDAEVLAARGAVEEVLQSVMCRTERIRSTHSRDSMMAERRTNVGLTSADVACAVEVDKISRLVGAGDAIEYWKSAPYLLSFMESYELKERLSGKKGKGSAQLSLPPIKHSTLRKEQVTGYTVIDPANPRMRSLVADTIDSGSWKLLWLPPAVPYIAPTGPYAGLGPEAATKALIFSSWNVVPKALAVLLSYEAERRMVDSHDGKTTYETLSSDRRPLLTFRVDSDGRPSGMTALALLYPCATLAEHVDPLELALELGHGDPVDLETVRERIAQRVRPLVARLVAKHGNADAQGPVDQRWYWAILALLDAQHHAPAIEWADSQAGLRGLFDDDDEDAEHEADEEVGAADGFTKHVQELVAMARGQVPLGRAPEDLERVVADFALASPAVCALRALRRISGLSAWEPVVLSAAGHIAVGFRTLFNVPETISLLRGDAEQKPYWRRVLEYCVDGNLQAVLDEYAHLLVENVGCVGSAPATTVDKVSKAMQSALSPRTANLSVDEVTLEAGQVKLQRFSVRTRYALRFGDLRDEDGGTVMRAGAVRDAFNSPFRPFVLASTSVGQEGLDFHPYCHAVYHWNLPSNPVDLEQREGRVHRYKGHAVRRNVALRYGLKALADRWNGLGDPWQRLFELASESRLAGANELVPFWVFETEGGFKVERRVPLLPLSREVHRLDKLKQQLSVYRLAFGQPRQDDLLSYLASLKLPPDAIDAWRISLEPTRQGG